MIEVVWGVGICLHPFSNIGGIPPSHPSLQSSTRRVGIIYRENHFCQRRAIIQKHPEIPYKIDHKDFPDKWSAIAWMCRNQLGRRNLTDEQKTYLIGKQYEAQKMTEKFHGNQHSGGHHYDDYQPGRTKSRIAKALGIGSATVERAEMFANGLDAAEKVSPGIKDAILSGEIKAPKQTIANIRKAPEEKGKHKGNSKLYLKKSEHYKRKNWKLAEKHRNS